MARLATRAELDTVDGPDYDRAWPARAKATCGERKAG
jgi:hypothetical protein